jgi:beta-glucanase (GH16 family)
MKVIYFLWPILLGSSAAFAETLVSNPPPSAPVAGGGWKLVWADEFDYTGLPDPAKWDYEVGYVRNKEAQYYTRVRKENAWVEGGVLTITGRKEKFPIPQGRGNRKGAREAEYTAASLITRGKASWTFGRVELRAKLPRGRGVWPAFWTLGTAGGWPRGGEIDIMEYFGLRPRDVTSNIHFALGGRHKSFGGKVTLDNPWDDFHVYAMDWNSDRMDFSCDGTKYYTFDLSRADENGNNPFRKSQYLILNLALGGTAGGPIDDAILPQKFVIDYVRVYQRGKDKSP